ncbi:MAG: hypothetical protein GXP14_13725 [Gammaproteobacteria bacterium]|nr:hypothetical protein [Gammaproteobacteria bacterium]
MKIGVKREAANAGLFYIDDTTNRILGQKSEHRPNRNGKGSRLRTGIYTSGLIAVTDAGEHLYYTIPIWVTRANFWIKF